MLPLSSGSVLFETMTNIGPTLSDLDEIMELLKKQDRYAHHQYFWDKFLAIQRDLDALMDRLNAPPIQGQCAIEVRLANTPS
jgi:hypothetical protein